MGFLAQQDPRWSGITLGTGPGTIGQYGLPLFARVITSKPVCISPIPTLFRTIRHPAWSIKTLGLFTATILTGKSSTLKAHILRLVRRVKLEVAVSALSSKSVVLDVADSMSSSIRKQQQIGKRVIELVAIDMMDLLSPIKLAAHRLFHNVTVIVNVFTIYPYLGIAVRGNNHNIILTDSGV